MIARDLLKARCEGCNKKGGAHRKNCPALHATLHAAALVRRATHAVRAGSPMTVGQMFAITKGKRSWTCTSCGEHYTEKTRIGHAKIVGHKEFKHRDSGRVVHAAWWNRGQGQMVFKAVSTDRGASLYDTQHASTGQPGVIRPHRRKSHYVGLCHCGSTHRTARSAHRSSVTDRGVKSGYGTLTTRGRR